MPLFKRAQIKNMELIDPQPPADDKKFVEFFKTLSNDELMVALSGNFAPEVLEQYCLETFALSESFTPYKDVIVQLQSKADGSIRKYATLSPRDVFSSIHDYLMDKYAGDFAGKSISVGSIMPCIEKDGHEKSRWICAGVLGQLPTP